MELNPKSLFLDHHSTISAPPPPPAAPPPAPHAHHQPHFFYWGKEAQFLFSGWPDNHTGMYALAIILVFFVAIVVEFLSNLDLVKPGSHRTAAVFFQAGFHAVRAGLRYMVILAVMSYNGGVFIAAALGHAVGYVIFGSGLSRKEARPNRCI
ncbi:copper transporter 4-like [Andrographis paniculata]|uniref:copper transporter 4-like n=1 Tax=Andrographis paniculata TaxID=175694 RepID=UPI0021E838BF|nr:copper transporter 4-like [Andrographis paniculata]